MPLRVGCRADDPDKHEFDVNQLVFAKGKLYSAGDDGKIKVWTTDLRKLAEVQAHASSVFSIAVSTDTLYSASNDGSVKAFELETLKEKATLLQDKDSEFWKLRYVNEILYSGDNQGNVTLLKHGKVLGTVNVAEPVKDLAIDGSILYSVKDVDVTVTELIMDDPLQFGVKKTFVGRAPLTLAGNKLLLSSREGKDILVHLNSDQDHFKEVSQIKNAHPMVINALAGTVWDGKTVLFSGGWDKNVKKWTIGDGENKEDGSVNVDIVVNTIAIGEDKEIYAAGGDGHIVRVEVE